MESDNSKKYLQKNISNVTKIYLQEQIKINCTLPIYTF